MMTRIVHNREMQGDPCGTGLLSKPETKMYSNHKNMHKYPNSMYPVPQYQDNYMYIKFLG